MMLRILCVALMLVGYSACGDFEPRQSVRDATSIFTPDFRAFRWRCPLAVRSEVQEAMGKLMRQREGVYRSDNIFFNDFIEWKGVARLRLHLFGNAGAALLLEDSTGNIRHAPRSEDGFFSDRFIFLGPEEDGLLFYYSIVSNRLYALFSPNGIQHRIVFTRTGEKVDKNLLVQNGMSPQNRALQAERKAEEVSRKEQEEWFLKIRGVYVSDCVPERDRTNGVIRLWLKINNHNNVFLLSEEKDGLYLRMRDHDYSWINRTDSFLGMYAISDGQIRFDLNPPALDERARVMLDGYVRCRKSSESCDVYNAYYERSIEHFNAQIPLWINGEYGKMVFSRVKESDFPRESIRVMRFGDGKEAFGQERDRLLELLDDLSYKFNTPLL